MSKEKKAHRKHRKTQECKPQFEMRKTNREGRFKYKGNQYGILGMIRRRVLVAPHPPIYNIDKTVIVKPYPPEYELTPIENFPCPSVCSVGNKPEAIQ